jgi:hypothetical protein
MLINKAPSSKGKNPNQIPPPPHHLLSPSRVFLGSSLVRMADADGSHLNLGSPVALRGQVALVEVRTRTTQLWPSQDHHRPLQLSVVPAAHLVARTSPR